MKILKLLILNLGNVLDLCIMGENKAVLKFLLIWFWNQSAVQAVTVQMS